jgi:hypothetical protein
MGRKRDRDEGGTPGDGQQERGRRRDLREVSRRALHQATEGLEPDLTRLLDAVPGILLEAERRRRRRATRDALSASVPLARWAIPRLAAAAALLVVLAGALLYTTPTATDESLDLDELILSDSDSLTTDAILGVLVETGESNG